MNPQPKKLFLIAIITTITIAIVGALVIAVSKSPTSPSQTPFPGTIILNLPQSTALLNQPLSFHLTATDEYGLELCQLPLELSLTLPSDQTQNLSVIPGPTCDPTQVSNEPGYTAALTPDQPGIYTATLLLDNSPVLEPLSFTVPSSPPPLSFERYSPSRLSLQPPARYPMVITLTAHQPFQGTISDTLPTSYNFAWYGSAQVTESAKSKTISWDVNLQAGEIIELKYDYLPTTSGPTQLGPLLANQTPQPSTPWHQLVTPETN